MTKLYAKVLAVFMALVMAAGLTGCGQISIIGLAIPAVVELTEGDTGVLEVSFSADKENATDEAILEAAEKLTPEWESSDEAVVTVDGNGSITAVKGGEATVTVKAGEILSACKITVSVFPICPYLDITVKPCYTPSLPLVRSKFEVKGQ